MEGRGPRGKDRGCVQDGHVGRGQPTRDAGKGGGGGGVARGPTNHVGGLDGVGVGGIGEQSSVIVGQLGRVGHGDAIAVDHVVQDYSIWSLWGKPVEGNGGAAQGGEVRRGLLVWS